MAGLWDRYNSGGRNTLDVLYMGVQGDFGETTFPDFYYSTRVLEHDRGPGDYHAHASFWCGDEYAVRSFKDYLRNKYDTLERLNSAWGSECAMFEDVGFPGWPFPDRRRAWLDFIEWYTGSMTAFVSECARIARKRFPENTIMVPLGTGCQAVLSGQDETALAKEMSKHKVAIRTTAGAATHPTQLYGHEATEAFCRMYPYVKLISTACRYYDTPIWIEPPYPPGPSGSAMLWGLFEALSHGIAGCMQWSKTVMENRDFYRKYRDFFTVERPVVDTAVLSPTTDHRIRATNVMPTRFVELCARLRRAADYDVLDERLIRDGALKNYAILVLGEGRVFEEDTLAEIERWVSGGGIFLLYDTGFPLETVEGERAYTETFTGINHASIPYSVHEITWHAEALFRTASSGIEWAPSVRNLSGDVNALMRAKTDGAVVWERRLGAGRCIVFAGDFSHKDLYLNIARDCIYNRHVLDSRIESPPPITEGWDDIFSTLTENWLFVLNLTEDDTVCRYGNRDVRVEPWSLERVARGGENAS